MRSKVATNGFGIFHIFIHNISNFPNLIRCICKIQCKPMGNLTQNQKRAKLFPTTTSPLPVATHSIITMYIFCIVSLKMDQNNTQLHLVNFELYYLAILKQMTRGDDFPSLNGSYVASISMKNQLNTLETLSRATIQ